MQFDVRPDHIALASVVLPSDLDGLIYKKIAGSIDSQAYALIEELKAAGYNISV